MADWLARTRLLVGKEAVERLARSRIAVLGLGGVGSGAAEGICRSGVGAMLLADCDEVDLTNLNRQLIATTATVGQSKTLAASRRLLDINPAPSTMSPPSWRWPSCAGGRAFPSSPVWAPATGWTPPGC